MTSHPGVLSETGVSGLDGAGVSDASQGYWLPISVGCPGCSSALSDRERSPGREVATLGWLRTCTDKISPRETGVTGDPNGPRHQSFHHGGHPGGAGRLLSSPGGNGSLTRHPGSPGGHFGAWRQCSEAYASPHRPSFRSGRGHSPRSQADCAGMESPTTGGGLPHRTAPFRRSYGSSPSEFRPLGRTVPPDPGSHRYLVRRVTAVTIAILARVRLAKEVRRMISRNGCTIVLTRSGLAPRPTSSTHGRENRQVTTRPPQHSVETEGFVAVAHGSRARARTRPRISRLGCPPVCCRVSVPSLAEGGA